MPQSLSAVYIHLVFSTKNREPFLCDEQMRTGLHAELGGISKKLECPPMITGGTEDHVHVLARFGRTIAGRLGERIEASFEPVAERAIPSVSFRMASWLC